MSCGRCALEVMLKVFEPVCSSMGMCVNAARAELLTVNTGGTRPESVQLSGGEAH